MKKNRLVIGMRTRMIVSHTSVKLIYSAKWSGDDPPKTTITRSTKGWRYTCTCKASHFGLECYHKKNFKEYLEVQKLMEEDMHFIVFGYRFSRKKILRSGDQKTWREWQKCPLERQVCIIIKQMLAEDMHFFDSDEWQITRIDPIEKPMPKEQCIKRCQLLNAELEVTKENYYHVKDSLAHRPSKIQRYMEAYASTSGRCRELLLGVNREQIIEIAQELNLKEILWHIPGLAPGEDDG